MYRSAPDDRRILIVKSSQNPASYTNLRPSMTSSRTTEWFMSNKSNLIQNVVTRVEKSSYNNHWRSKNTFSRPLPWFSGNHQAKTQRPTDWPTWRGKGTFSILSENSHLSTIANLSVGVQSQVPRRPTEAREEKEDLKNRTTKSEEDTLYRRGSTLLSPQYPYRYR